LFFVLFLVVLGFELRASRNIMIVDRWNAENQRPRLSWAVFSLF
jgi:hypothetical protein